MSSPSSSKSVSIATFFALDDMTFFATSSNGFPEISIIFSKPNGRNAFASLLPSTTTTTSVLSFTSSNIASKDSGDNIFI